MIRNLIDYESLPANLQQLLGTDESLLEDLRISLKHEEKLTTVPMITDEVIFALMRMYKLGLYTEKSEKCISYIRASITEDKELDKILLVAESNNGYFDSSFNDRLIRLYKSNEIFDFDKVINRMVNHKNFLFDSRLIDIIYDFYKRHNDINSLTILIGKIIENKISLRETPIVIRDVLNLKDTYKEEGDLGQLIKLLRVFEYYKEQQEVEEVIVNIIKKIIFVTRNKTEKLIAIRDSIKEYKDRADSIKDAYLYLVAYEGIRYEAQVWEFEEALRTIIREENLKKDKAVLIIKAIIIFYCLRNDYENIVKYVDFYLYQLAAVDRYKTLTELIKNHKTKYIGEAVLLAVNKIDIRTLEAIIGEACDRVISTENYINIINALETLEKKRVSSAGYMLAEKYLRACDYIPMKEYEIIAEKLRGMPRDKQKKLYEEMIKKADLPIELRLEFFDLCKASENLEIIYESFIKKEIYSRELKDYAAKQYYNYDKEFLKIVAIEECSLEVLELVNKKVKENLTYNLSYVKNLLEVVQNRDSVLNSYKDSLDRCIDDESEKNSIIGEYERISEVSNDFCDSGELISIFDRNQKYTYIAFNNEAGDSYRVRNILTNYMYNNGFSYIDDLDMVFFKEIHYKRQYINQKIIDVLENVLKLLRLQMSLARYKICASEFTLEGLIYSKDIIIPKSLSYLEEPEEEIIKTIIAYLGMIIDAKIEEITTREELESINKIKKQIISPKELNSYNDLLFRLSAIVEPAKLNPQKLSFKAQIEEFHRLPTVAAKEAIIDKIINHKLTIIEAKRLVICWEGKLKSKEAFLDYLFLCFNTSRAGLDQEEILSLYNKIIGFIRRNPALVNKDKKRLFFINASIVMKLNKEILERDIYNKNC